MLWFKSHRRFQEQLSAYIDGELPEKDALALDAHVESCDACAREFEELRLASAALQELPDVEAPRSFKLSPADVARPAAPAVHSLNSGLRLTGAGLAAALAILLVLDTGGIVGGGRSARDDAERSALAPVDANADKAMGGADALSESDSYESGSADGFFATESPMPEVSGTPIGTPLEGVGTDGGMGSTSSVDSAPASGGNEPTGTPLSADVYSGPPVEESPAAPTQLLPATGGETDGTQVPLDEHAASAGSDATPTPTPTATPLPSESPADAAAELGPNGFEEQDTETLTAMDSSVDSDDGPSALLVTEIVLAALLGASVVGVAAATHAERRRR